jgi:hypothetical protein
MLNMRKSATWLGSILLLAGVVGLLFVPNEFAGKKDEKKFSNESDANLEAKKKLIRRELKTLRAHPWAGQYYYGDGLGVNVYLSLAPKSGFAFTWNGCLGLYDLNYGDVVEVDGSIRLVFRLPNEHKGFEGIPSEFLPVIWGDRHYLISPDEVVEFANAINAGFEPRKTEWGSFLLRRGDVNKRATGYPNLPSEYSAYILKHPIEAEVSSVKNSYRNDSGRVTTVLLNVGTTQGVKKGMEFYLYEPSNVFESATITSVGNTSSEAEIFQCCDEKAGPPSPGWKLSTYSGRN